ncbi:MAG: hypothetical protein MJE68_22490, partial [Proteobacteria bacterium]|nr:hypothetical protein [Pseudomonadota bacterium]
LGINRDNIIKRGTIIPNHLNISVSCEEDKDKVTLLINKMAWYSSHLCPFFSCYLVGFDHASAEFKVQGL